MHSTHALKKISSTGQLSLGNNAGTNNNTQSANFVSATCTWRKESNSRSGTCLPLCIDVPQGNGIPSKGNNVGDMSSRVIPPLQLIWKGEEALDKLHMAIRVKIPVGGFNGGASSSSNKSKSNSSSSHQSVEYVEGHCAIGLEKLCKLGLCSIPPLASNMTTTTTTTTSDRDRMISTSSISNNYNVHVKTSIAQLLVKNGTPMYHIDNNTLQVHISVLLLYYCIAIIHLYI